jgi:LuxR family transcriptional regulator, maltose regulon positive regulatory protein
MLTQSRRALEYLHPNNLASRTTAHWTLGVAYSLQGNRTAARRAYTEAIALSQAAGESFTTILATLGLGNIQEADNQLFLAAETYRRVLQLAQGDVAGAAALLAEAGQSARQHNFVDRMPEIAAAQVLILLRQGDLAAAAHLAQAHELPLSQARVHLAQGDPSAALAVLQSLREQVEAKGWADERLRVIVLQAVALQAHGEKVQAVHLLLEALALAEQGGFIRLFIDEGRPMAHLLSEAAAHGIMPDYIGKLLAVFEAEEQQREDTPSQPPAQPLIEPLSPRELEVLHFMAQGRSNQEMSERLFLALSTVKGHNRKIFGKLQVQRRTEAVARARELGLLSPRRSFARTPGISTY